MSSIQIRRACDADAAALARLAEHTFRATFAPFNSPANMQRHCERAYGPAVQLREIRDPRLDTWLAGDGGKLLGYLQLRRGIAPAGIRGESPLEIQRLYLDASAHGRGFGHELMQHIIDCATAAGNDILWLGVWEHNARAQAFYRKWGFTLAGEHIFLLGEDPQRDLLMYRPVSTGREAAS